MKRSSLDIRHRLIGDYDDQIADSNQVGRGSVDPDDTAPRLPFNDVSLQTRTVGHIDHRHPLTDQQVSRGEQVRIDRDLPYVCRSACVTLARWILALSMVRCILSPRSCGQYRMWWALQSPPFSTQLINATWAR
jgi:hypothetical protein